MAGNSICFADNNEYFLMNMERGRVTPIIPITQSSSRETSNRSLSGTTKPNITSIGDTEFLLSAATLTYILLLNLLLDNDK
jgi:hypothetical protein